MIEGKGLVVTGFHGAKKDGVKLNKLKNTL